MPASSSRGRLTWFQESHGRLCVWNREHSVAFCLLRSDWSLRWLDVCICTDASEKGFAFAVREGCRELPSEVGRVSERTRFKRSSRSIRALQLLDPTEWRLAAYGGFFREEHIVVLEARTILYAVRFAESSYPPVRLLILSDNLALVLALCKKTLKNYIAFSQASNLCVRLQGRFCLIVLVDTVGVELFREGTSFL